MKPSTAASLSPDRPDVVIFPPVLPLTGLVLGFVLQHFVPVPPWPVWLFGILRLPAATMLVVGGLGLMIASGAVMVRAGTPVSPRQPVRQLVEQWPFTWSRNPMYLGGNSVLLGLGLIFRLSWVGLLFPVLMAICHYGVVLREERYLEQKFGEEYRAYKGRVRRWL